MRDDTEEICNLLDKAADLVGDDQLEEAQRLLPEISKLMTEWIERNLFPLQKSGP